MTKFAVLLALSAMSVWADTWNGTISDAKCTTAHMDASEKSIACVQKCVKSGVAPVFITEDRKVIKIENPDTVKEHLGHKVQLTGDLKGDTVTVESIKMAEQ